MTLNTLALDYTIKVLTILFLCLQISYDNFKSININYYIYVWILAVIMTAKIPIVISIIENTVL